MIRAGGRSAKELPGSCILRGLRLDFPDEPIGTGRSLRKRSAFRPLCNLEARALTDKERMLAGELYLASDPELLRDRARAAALVRDYNQAVVDEQPRLLQELLGAVGAHTVVRSPFFCDYGFNIRLGVNVFLNFGCVLLDVVEIEIGDGTQIGPCVQVYAADHPRDPAVRRQGLENGRPVHVGRNVWIGGAAVLLPGVRVGDDAIIGAGAIVTRDVPEGWTVAGNPARRIERRQGDRTGD